MYSKILKIIYTMRIRKGFSKKCPIPFDKFLIIGLCMSEGKTVPLEQQNWYMAEQQRRAAEEIKDAINKSSRRS